MTLDLWRRLVVRRVVEKKLRFGLTLLGIAVGIALFLAIQILNHSTVQSFRQSLERVSGQAALTVYTGGASFSEEVLAKVEGTEGVKYAIPLVEARAFYEADGQFQSFTMLCVDLLKDGGVRSYQSGGRDLIEDPLVFLNQPDSLMLPRAFTRKLGLEMESPLELFGATGRKRFTLRGILDDDGAAKAYGGGIGIMDIDGCRQTFGKVGLLDKIDIVPKEGVDVAALEARLRSELDGLGLKVGRANDQAAAFEVMVTAFQKMLSFIGWLAVLVSFFIVTDTVQVAIAERTKEIATLRALGASRRRSFGLLLWESLTLGTLGSALGLLLGVLLAHKLMGEISASLSTQFVRDIEIDAIHVEFRHVVMAFALGLTSCFVATLVPAWKASRRDIVQDLRNRTEDESSGRSGGDAWKAVVGTVAFVAMALLVRARWSARWPAFYGVEAALAIVALIWLGPALVDLVLGGLSRVVGRGPPGRTRFLAALALDNLRRNRERTKSNVLGLVVSLGLVIVISTINASARSNIMGWFRKTLHSDLVVSSYGNLLNNRSQVFSEDIRSRIEAMPGLKEEAGIKTYAVRWINFEHGGVDITVKAFDPPPPSHLLDVFDLIEGPSAKEIYRKIFVPGDRVYALASSSYFRTFGVKIGDEIEIRTTSGPLRIVLAGSVVDYASPNGVVYLSREVYRKYWKDPLVAAYFMNLENPSRLADFKARFDREFFDVGLQALSNHAVLEQGEKSVNDAFGFTRAIELSAVLVALFGLVNTLFVSVLGRIREFGMLRSVGSSKSQLRKLVLFEAVILSGVGAFVALCFGYALSRFWVLESLPEMLGWPLRFVFPYASVLKVLGLGIVVGIVSGWAPSRLVTGRSPTELMREDG